MSKDNQSSYAAVNGTFPDQTINIEQGTTEATLTFNATVDNTTYTKGYSVFPYLNNTLPTGIEITSNGDPITTTGHTAIAREYEKISGTDNGQITYTITIPADAPVGDNYQTITLNYDIDDIVYPLATIQQKMNDATPDSLVNMQQLTSTICADAVYDGTSSTLAARDANNVITLTDTRNSQPYYIGKMPDDKCWMLTNLRYAPPSGTGEGQATLVSDATSSSYTIPQYADSPNGSTNYTIYTPASANAFLGYLYNWCAANDGQSTACTAASTNPGTINTAKSVCPSSWRLPTGVTSGEFQTLYIALGGSYNTFVSGFRAVHGGFYYNSFGFAGSNGYYWSSSPAVSPGSARILYFTTSDVGLTNIGTRPIGYSVRCVL